MNIIAAETSEKVITGTKAFGSNLPNSVTHTYIGVEMCSWPSMRAEFFFI